jgi:hypothetical protein
MSRAAKEIFLKNLFSELVSRYPKWHIEKHCRIEWKGNTRNMWPEADLVINMPGRRFIVEYDEEGYPGRSLLKYWYVLTQTKRVSFTIIEVCKRGQSIDHDIATFIEWIGAKLMKLNPGTIHEFIEMTDEPAELIASKIVQIILGGQRIQDKRITPSLDG